MNYCSSHAQHSTVPTRRKSIVRCQTTHTRMEDSDQPLPLFSHPRRLAKMFPKHRSVSWPVQKRTDGWRGWSSSSPLCWEWGHWGSAQRSLQEGLLMDDLVQVGLRSGWSSWLCGWTEWFCGRRLIFLIVVERRNSVEETGRQLRSRWVCGTRSTRFLPRPLHPISTGFLHSRRQRITAVSLDIIQRSTRGLDHQSLSTRVAQTDWNSPPKVRKPTGQSLGCSMFIQLILARHRKCLYWFNRTSLVRISRSMNILVSLT